MSLSELQEYGKLLTKALDGSLTLEENPTEGGTDITQLPDTDGNPIEIENVENTEHFVATPENKLINAIKRAKNEKLRAMIKKMVSSREESENNLELRIEGTDQPLNNENNKSNSDIDEETSPTKKNKRIRIVDSSDDDEEPIDNRFLGEDESDKLSFRPAIIHDFSDEDEPSSTQRSILQENTEEMFKSARIIVESDDSEEEPSIPLKKSKAKTNILESDEDGVANSDKENSEENNVDESKRLRSTSDSESEKPKPKRSRVIISDDEN